MPDVVGDLGISVGFRPAWVYFAMWCPRAVGIRRLSACFPPAFIIFHYLLYALILYKMLEES
jgi:hypothetical protein